MTGVFANSATSCPIAFSYPKGFLPVAWAWPTG
jgi:hypothetical protein